VADCSGDVLSKTDMIFVYNFYSGVNFCGKKIAGTLFCGNFFFADREKKQQKLEPAKI